MDSFSTQSGNSPERRIVYLKLRKTGGTSLSSSILFPYCVRHGLRYMDPVNWWAVHPRSVAGDSFHMMFRHFPDYRQPWARNWLEDVIGDYRLVTMLRDPVSRLVSGFNHTNHYNRPMGFEHYVRKHHEANHQSHWLGFDGRDPDFLRKRFAAIGITERFDESMLLYRRCLGLSLADMLYVRQRSDVVKTIRRSDLDDKTVGMIRDLNWLDVRLFEQAQQLLTQRVDETPGLAAELDRYRSALQDFRHPLWQERGSFPIGYTENYVWSVFDHTSGTVRNLRQLRA